MHSSLDEHLYEIDYTDSLSKEVWNKTKYSTRE
jgi:hypothetical protein